MLTTILSLIAPMLSGILRVFIENKTLLIITLCTLIVGGALIEACNYGERRQAAKDDVVITALQKRLDDLHNAPVITTERSEPSPIKIGPLRGGGKAVSAPITDILKHRVDSLQEVNANLQNMGNVLHDEGDSLRNHLAASRKMNYQLSASFKQTFRDSTTANDSLNVPYQLWVRFNPLNQLLGLRSIEYRVTLSDIPWVTRIVERLQQVELQAVIQWWEYAIAIIAAIGMFFLGKV